MKITRRVRGIKRRANIPVSFQSEIHVPQKLSKDWRHTNYRKISHSRRRCIHVSNKYLTRSSSKKSWINRYCTLSTIPVVPIRLMESYLRHKEREIKRYLRRRRR